MKNWHHWEGGSFDGMISCNFLDGRAHTIKRTVRNGEVYEWKGFYRMIDGKEYRILEYQGTDFKRNDS